MTKTKVQLPNGTVADAEEVDFDAVSEPWATFKLNDGTTLKIRILLGKVLRLDMHNPDGDPVYQIFANNQVRAVNVPKELKKYAKFDKPDNREVA